MIGHAENTFTVDLNDTGEGWLGPIRSADEGEPPLRLAEMLLSAPPPTIEPLALIADFLDRHHFAHTKRGKPKADSIKPWISEQMRKLARDLMVNCAHLPAHPTVPAKWRVDLAEQLLSFRLAGAPTNHRPPAYQRTLRDAQLLCAAVETRSVMRERGLRLEEAAELVAPLHSEQPSFVLPASTLIADMTGHRRSRRKNLR